MERETTQCIFDIHGNFRKISCRCKKTYKKQSKALKHLKTYASDFEQSEIAKAVKKL